MQEKKILVTGDFDLDPEWQKHFVINHIRSPHSKTAISNAIADCWAYVLGGPEYLDQDLLKIAKQLQHVVVMGTGTPSFVDEIAAKKAGIRVWNIPSLNSEAVAEYAIGIIISSLANVFSSIDGVYSGNFWMQQARKPLSEIKLCIVGMGAIGKDLLVRAKKMGVRHVRYVSRSRKNEIEREFGAIKVDLGDGMAWADVASIHLPYDSVTHEIIDDSILKMANVNLKILHFSNPKIIAPNALFNWLQNNKNGFVYFDGYYQEWVQNKGCKEDAFGLLGLGPNKFVASSHIAAQEIRVLSQLQKAALERLESLNES